MSKQTVVDVIFDNFNLLSDAEFKSWMLNKYDELKAMEKEQHLESYRVGNTFTNSASLDFKDFFDEHYTQNL